MREHPVKIIYSKLLSISVQRAVALCYLATQVKPPKLIFYTFQLIFFIIYNLTFCAHQSTIAM